jgi:hypothetical protein
MYQVQARYRFQNGNRDDYETGWSEPLIVEVTSDNPENNAPGAPSISGPNNGDVGVEYPYTFISNDPDDDDIYYWIIWGDGCPAVEWIGPYASGEEVTVSHSFLKSGKITISAQVRDVYEAESAWGSFDVEMPRARMKSNNLFGNFIYRLAHSFPMLRLLMFRLG